MEFISTESSVCWPTVFSSGSVYLWAACWRLQVFHPLWLPPSSTAAPCCSVLLTFCSAPGLNLPPPPASRGGNQECGVPRPSPGGDVQPLGRMASVFLAPAPHILACQIISANVVLYGLAVCFVCVGPIYVKGQLFPSWQCGQLCVRAV